MPTLPPTQPEPVSFDTPVGDVTGNIAIEYADGQLVVLQLDRHDAVDAKYWTSHSVHPTFIPAVPDGAELSDLALTLAPARPIRAFRLPAGAVRATVDTRLGLLRAGAFLGLLVVAITCFVLIPNPMLSAALGMSALLGSIAAAVWMPRWVASSLAEYVTADGATPLQALLDDRPLGRKADRLVDDVRAEYGTLLADVVERIERPALFDPAVPATKEFTAALIEWDNGRHLLSPADRASLAGRVRVLFDAARAHAEHVGMDHLPPEARRPAAQAAKALRVARSSSATKAERAEALRAANRILESLMLYYLPTVSEVEELVAGRTPKALPGRRTAEDLP